MNITDSSSNDAWLAAGALGRVVGVHGVHGRDIFQLRHNWCWPCSLYVNTLSSVLYDGVRGGGLETGWTVVLVTAIALAARWAHHDGLCNVCIVTL